MTMIDSSCVGTPHTCIGHISEDSTQQIVSTVNNLTLCLCLINFLLMRWWRKMQESMYIIYKSKVGRGRRILCALLSACDAPMIFHLWKKSPLWRNTQRKISSSASFSFFETHYRSALTEASELSSWTRCWVLSGPCWTTTVPNAS